MSLKFSCSKVDVNLAGAWHREECLSGLDTHVRRVI